MQGITKEQASERRDAHAPEEVRLNSFESFLLRRHVDVTQGRVHRVLQCARGFLDRLGVPPRVCHGVVVHGRKRPVVELCAE